MSHDEDLDLERRLRRIAEDPEPAVPGSLYRHLDIVAEGAAGEGVRPAGRAAISALPRGRQSDRSQVRALVALAAVLFAFIAGGILISVPRTTGPAAEPSVPASDRWTRLEWHDVTSTSAGLFAANPWDNGITFPAAVVAWPGGLAATNGSGVWTSIDGRTWKLVSGPQYAKFLGVIGGHLVALTDPVASCAEIASGPCLTSGRIWAKGNGDDWTSELLPFSGSLMSLTTSPTSAVITVLPMTSADPGGPQLIYVSADGIDWHQAQIPADMSTSTDLIVSSMAADFIAIGKGVNPGNSGSASPELYWVSGDALVWSRISPDVPNQRAMFALFRGLLGLASPGLMGDVGLHSADGVTWVYDQDQVPSGLSGQSQEMSDGRRIVVAENWNTEFWASLGDGHWQPLEQGGDIGSLPGGGQAWLLPNGVLYAGGGRLFYGMAVVDAEVQGTLRPAATITAPPTTTPAVSAQPTNSSSVIAAPTSQPSPTATGP
jgi:hypothetical protein